MNIILSWDLFVVVFFVVILAYSFIIGRDNTLKVILGTYISMIASDALGNLVQEYFTGSPIFIKFLEYAMVGNAREAVIFLKVLLFVILVILFAVKGAFYVETVDDRSAIERLGLSVFYAILSAGLIISTILVYISGTSFIGGDAGANLALWNLYNQSNMIRLIVQYSHLWFSIPALAFLAHSLYSHRE